MSEKTPPQLVNAARAADDLRAHLGTLDKNELVELCLHVVRTYVIESAGALTRGEGQAQPGETHGEETFAGILRRLKRERPDPLLDRFIVEGENISVRIGNEILPLTEYRRAPPPRQVQTEMRQMRPGVSVNSAPRDPFGAAPPQPAAPQPAPQPGQKRPAPAQEEKPKGDVPPPGGPRLIEMD